jgi:hypothetical protein
MLQGAGMGQQAVSAAAQDKYNQFRMMSEGQKMVDQRKAQEQAARDQQRVASILSGGGAPDVSPLANGQGPTVANAAAQAPASPLGDKLRQVAQLYLEQNRPEDAKRAMDMAAQQDEKFSQTPQVVMRNGKPVNALIGERGTVKTLDGYDPTPKFREVNDGKQTRILNDYSISPSGMNIAMQTTPGQDQSHSVALANLALARNADARAAKAAAQANEPAWVNDLERGIQIDPRSGNTRPIMAGGQPVGAKGESKKAESAESAQAIVDLAKPLIKKSTGSYSGAAWDQVMQGIGVSTSGADANAQLKVLQARLMTEQPRMEGPQSDRDVELYRQAAGEIGDPTIPKSRKMAALTMISALNDRYRRKPAASAGATGQWSITPVSQ